MTTISILYKIGENIVVVLRIAIFLLLCDNQDMESKSREIKMYVAGSILTQEKHQSFYGTTIYILYKMDDNFVAIIFIYGAGSISCLCFVITKA